MSDPGLTEGECKVLGALTNAWNEFMQLPARAEHDDAEMQQVIHRAQALIALRVARRADPTVWRQP